LGNKVINFSKLKSGWLDEKLALRPYKIVTISACLKTERNQESLHLDGP